MFDSDYVVKIYIIDNCTDDYDSIAMEADGGCLTSSTGKPWLSYRFTESTQ